MYACGVVKVPKIALVTIAPYQEGIHMETACLFINENLTAYWYSIVKKANLKCLDTGWKSVCQNAVKWTTDKNLLPEL